MGSILSDKGIYNVSHDTENGRLYIDYINGGVKNYPYSKELESEALEAWKEDLQFGSCLIEAKRREKELVQKRTGAFALSAISLSLCGIAALASNNIGTGMLVVSGVASLISIGSLIRANKKIDRFNSDKIGLTDRVCFCEYEDKIRESLNMGSKSCLNVLTVTKIGHEPLMKIIER